MKLSPLASGFQTSPLKTQGTQPDARETVNFLLNSYELKHTPRRGFVHIQNPELETVGAHSWGLALLVLTFLPKHLNLGKALTYATLHDLAEVITGDIIPSDNILPEEKRRREHAAIQSLCTKFPKLAALWERYESKSDEEAKFVKQLDSFDFALQCFRYKQKNRLDYAQEFENVSARISSPVLQPLLAEIKRRFKQK